MLEVLDGLLALVQFHSVTGSAAILISQAVLRELAVQSLTQPMRFKVYTLFRELLERHRDFIATIGNDFVTGVITAVDGEKDPRNLIIVFMLVPILTNALEPARNELAEELFDVIAVYFPITFEAPPGDKFGVTGDQLRDALSASFCATEKFASIALMLLCDKLMDSIERPTKLQCLRLLRACLQAYSAAAVNAQFPKIWPALVEDCGNIDDKVADAAVDVCGIIVGIFLGENSLEDACLDGSSTGRAWHPNIQTAAAMASTRCTAILKQPSGSLHRTRWACRLLRALAKPSPELCADVVAAMLPSLNAIQEDLLDNVPARRQQQVLASVHLIAVISEAAVLHCDGSRTHPFFRARHVVLTILQKVEAAVWCDAATRELVAISLGFLLESSGGEAAVSSWLLPLEEAKAVLAKVSKSVLDPIAGADRAAQSYTCVCIAVLLRTSKMYENSVLEIAIEPLYQQLQKSLENSGLHLLGTFATATDGHFVWILPKLVNLAEVRWSDASSTVDERTSAVRAVLQCVEDVVKISLMKTRFEGAVRSGTESCQRLFDFTCKFSDSPSDCLARTGSVSALRCITSALPIAVQQPLLSQAVDSFLDVQEADPSLLQAVAAILTGCDGSVAIPRASDLCAALYGVTSWTEPGLDSCDASGQCLGSLFNKNVARVSELVDAQAQIVSDLVRTSTDSEFSMIFEYDFCGYV